MKPSIGIIGGTGPAGSSLGLRMASLGHQVVVGSRDPERGAMVVTALKSQFDAKVETIWGDSNARAATCDIVIMATPWDGVEEMAIQHRRELAGKVVISMVNALYKQGRNMNALVLPRGSIAQHLAVCLPESTLVGAFHHAPAKELGKIDEPLGLDILVCSDDSAATTKVIALIDEIPGARGIDAGNLSAAMAIEAMTAVLINVNIRYKTRSSIRLSGIKEL